jgi:type VI secretion system protein ImpH
MGAPERESHTPLRNRFFKEFYRFSFFRAVALLEKIFPDKKPIGQSLRPSEEPVRFAVKPGLSFPASDIAGLRQMEGEQKAEMDIAFMGLIGPSGMLPYWVNELAIERSRQKDFALVDFLNIFHHRLISLFYMAWRKYDFLADYRFSARDRLSWYILSLMGLGTPGLVPRIGISEESLIFCSGLLSKQTPAAIAIETTVEYLASAKAEIHQFINRAIPLDPEDWTRLGSPTAALGVNATCGSLAWECQSKFRIHLGPVGYKHFIRFLPSGDMLRPIFAVVRSMVGIEYEFEIRIFLKKEEVPPCTLGAAAPDAPRLGWSMWTMTPGASMKEDPHITFQETDLKPS